VHRNAHFVNPLFRANIRGEPLQQQSMQKLALFRAWPGAGTSRPRICFDAFKAFEGLIVTAPNPPRIATIAWKPSVCFLKHIYAGLVASMLSLPITIEAQFSYSTNNNHTLSITKYTGNGGAVTIPSFINGLAVTTISSHAFAGCSNVTSVDIGSTVTNFNGFAFAGCSNLTSVIMAEGATGFGEYAFAYCTSLVSVRLPDRLTAVGDHMFTGCSGLNSLVIPSSVASFGSAAFFGCSNLTSVYFTGNAPSPVLSSGVFQSNGKLTVYYLPGTTGWKTTFGGRPTLLWNPSAMAPGIVNKQFGFEIVGPTNVEIVVEATDSLSAPTWLALATNTLAGGRFTFGDVQSTSRAQRYYQFRSP